MTRVKETKISVSFRKLSFDFFFWFGSISNHGISKIFWEEKIRKDGWREKDTFNGFSLELFCNWKRKEMLLELQ